MTGYRTLAAKGEAELVIQRSRFIGRAFPVESEAAALAILADIIGTPPTIALPTGSARTAAAPAIATTGSPAVPPACP